MQPDAIRLVLPGDAGAVRATLRALFAGRRLGHLAEADRGAAEIVLAEVLNNVVEHAYAGAAGEIELTIRVAGGGLDCTVMDDGRPMPGGEAPEGKAGDLLGGADLPEGGFGWLLIRALTRELTYRRIGGRNCLTFRLEAEQ